MDIESRLPADIAEKSKLLNEEELRSDYDLLISEVHFAIQSRAKDKANELIVKHIEKHKHIHTTRVDEKPEMWYYIDGIYKPNGRTYIKEFCRNVLKDYSNVRQINEIIAKIEQDTYIDPDDLFNNQNKYPELIPVLNGILNIFTREMIPFTPNLFFFNKLNVKYNKYADCAKIVKFVNEIVDSESVFKGLQELTGFTLYKKYKFEKAFVFVGKGRNGKSKWLEILTHMLGIDNMSNVDLNSMEKKDGFALARLFNKLVNVASEISTQALKDTGNFKAATGNDTLEANRKFKNSIKFKNYAKMIFTANNLPPTKDLTQGFFDRWNIIDFPYSFIPQKEINMLTEEQKELVKLQDPDVLKELLKPDQISGFLNWGLDGLDRLMLNKSFSTAEAGSIIKNKWIRKSDSIKAFIDEWIIQDHSAHINKSEFRKVYTHYCKMHKIKLISDKQIKKAIEVETGGATRRTYYDGKDIYLWEGVRFKNGINEMQNGFDVSLLPDTYMFEHIKSENKQVLISPLDCLTTISGYADGLNVTDLNDILLKDEDTLKKQLDKLVVCKQLIKIDNNYMIADEGWEFVKEQEAEE